MSDVIPLGEVPKDLGKLPKKMLAWCIRPDREGDVLRLVEDAGDGRVFFTGHPAVFVSVEV